MKKFNKIIMAILLMASFVSCSNGQTPTSKEQASIKEDELINYKYSVSVGDKWGFIDKTGKYVVEPQFDKIKDFSEGLASVEVGGKWGFINKTGKYIVGSRFDNAGEFSEGLANVKIKGKWGFIDKTGKYAVEPRFDDCSSNDVINIYVPCK